MKKAYITPVMEISRLETADIICSSILSVASQTDYVEPTFGDTPPIALTDIPASQN